MQWPQVQHLYIAMGLDHPPDQPLYLGWAAKHLLWVGGVLQLHCQSRRVTSAAAESAVWAVCFLDLPRQARCQGWGIVVDKCLLPIAIFLIKTPMKVRFFQNGCVYGYWEFQFTLNAVFLSSDFCNNLTQLDFIFFQLWCIASNLVDNYFIILPQLFEELKFSAPHIEYQLWGSFSRTCSTGLLRDILS